MGNAFKRQQSSGSNKRLIGKSSASKVFSNSMITGGKQNEYILEQKMKGNRRRIDPRVALNHQFEEIYKVGLSVAIIDWFLSMLGIDASCWISMLLTSRSQTRMPKLLFYYWQSHEPFYCKDAYQCQFLWNKREFPPGY